jgi:predicted nucleotide-binding protein (sugar kinase/HSP70/actin superfamily)
MNWLNQLKVMERRAERNFRRTLAEFYRNPTEVSFTIKQAYKEMLANIREEINKEYEDMLLIEDNKVVKSNGR